MAASRLVRTAVFAAGAALLLGAAPAAGLPVVVPRYDAAGTAELTSLLNAHRRAAGLRPLAADTRLAAVARRHTEWMAATGDLTHNLAMFSKASHTALRIAYLGENVAYSSESVLDAHRALLASPPHRANIESGRFAVVGVAVVRDAKGWVWATQAFGSAPAPVAAPVAARPAARPAPVAPARVAAPRRAPAARAARPVRTARPARVVRAAARRDPVRAAGAAAAAGLLPAGGPGGAGAVGGAGVGPAAGRPLPVVAAARSVPAPPGGAGWPAWLAAGLLTAAAGGWCAARRRSARLGP